MQVRSANHLTAAPQKAGARMLDQSHSTTNPGLRLAAPPHGRIIATPTATDTRVAAQHIRLLQAATNCRTTTTFISPAADWGLVAVRRVFTFGRAAVPLSTAPPSTSGCRLIDCLGLSVFPRLWCHGAAREEREKPKEERIPLVCHHENETERCVDAGVARVTKDGVGGHLHLCPVHELDGDAHGRLRRQLHVGVVDELLLALRDRPLDGSIADVLVQHDEL